MIELKEAQKYGERMNYDEKDTDIGTLLQAIGFKNLTQKCIVYTLCPIYYQSKNYFYNF